MRSDPRCGNFVPREAPHDCKVLGYVAPGSAAETERLWTENQELTRKLARAEAHPRICTRGDSTLCEESFNHLVARLGALDEAQADADGLARVLKIYAFPLKNLMMNHSGEIVWEDAWDGEGPGYYLAQQALASRPEAAKKRAEAVNHLKAENERLTSLLTVNERAYQEAYMISVAAKNDAEALRQDIAGLQVKMVALERASRAALLWLETWLEKFCGPEVHPGLANEAGLIATELEESLSTAPSEAAKKRAEAVWHVLQARQGIDLDNPAEVGALLICIDELRTAFGEEKKP